MDDYSPTFPEDDIAREINDKIRRALQFDLPLFLIIYYDHEAAKLAFIEKLRAYLFVQGVSSQSFDPRARLEHGAGNLYPRLTAACDDGSVCLLASLPSAPDSPALDSPFLDYLNLHRDQISREKLRLILFLRAGDAEQFITRAGDLWDFRDHTYWLERGRHAETTFLWQLPEQEPERIHLPRESRDELSNHLKKVRGLVDETTAPREKAALLFDLTKWLNRRRASVFAIEAAYIGIDLIPDDRSDLRAGLEHELGYALDSTSNLPEALHHYEKCLEIFREIGDRAGEGTTLNNISHIYQAWGEYDAAMKTLDRSLAIRKEIGDRTGEGITLNLISQIHISWSQYDEAMENLEQSLAISKEVGDRAVERASLNNISSIHFYREQYNEAMTIMEQSLEISREIGDHAGQWTTLNNISQVNYKRGRYDEAMNKLKQCLEISREIGARAEEGITLNNISKICIARGQYDEAIRLIEKSLLISMEIGSRAGEGRACWNLAREYERRGDLKKAIAFAERSVKIRDQTDHPDLAESQKYLTELEERLKESGT